MPVSKAFTIGATPDSIPHGNKELFMSKKENVNYLIHLYVIYSLVSISPHYLILFLYIFLLTSLYLFMSKGTKHARNADKNNFSYSRGVGTIYYKNRPTPASFSFIFGLFQSNIQFGQQIM